MASVFTYIYLLGSIPETKKAELVEFIRTSTSMSLKINDGKITFIYDPEANMIYPDLIPDVYTGHLFPDPMIPDDFLEFVAKNGELHICHRRKIESSYLSFSDLNSQTDYSKTINDLEAAGKVKTVPSNNYLSNDPRKFFFVDENLGSSGIQLSSKVGSSEIQEYEVDCLGTMLCQDITQRVAEAWQEIYETSAYKKDLNECRSTRNI